MLAAGTTAKIVTSYQNFSLPVGGLVKHKFSHFAAIAVIAHFVEQIFTEARPFDRFQKLFRDYHIGIDIQNIQRRRHAGQLIKFLHLVAPFT